MNDPLLKAAISRTMVWRICTILPNACTILSWEQLILALYCHRMRTIVVYLIDIQRVKDICVSDLAPHKKNFLLALEDHRSMSMARQTFVIGILTPTALISCDKPVVTDQTSCGRNE